MKIFSRITLGLALGIGLLLPGFAGAAQTTYPLSVDNGNRRIHFDAAPKRVVSNCDSNIIELMFVLGLEDRLVGYAGFVEEGNNVSPRYQEKLLGIPVVTPGYVTLEPLLAADPDFFLSGYSYGLHIPGDTTADAITPEELEKHGIKSYAITESLIRVMKKPRVTLEDTYTDLVNLGRIFDVQERAHQVITSMQKRVAAVEAKLKQVENRPLKVFIYQTWNAPDQPPRTVGAQAMPSALLDMVKAENIFADVDDSYITASWEDVVMRNPDVVLLLECGHASGEERKNILLANPLLKDVHAIKDGRIVVLRVEELYPGPRAIDGLEKLAKAFYPGLF